MFTLRRKLIHLAEAIEAKQTKKTAEFGQEAVSVLKGAAKFKKRKAPYHMVVDAPNPVANKSDLLRHRLYQFTFVVTVQGVFCGVVLYYFRYKNRPFIDDLTRAPYIGHRAIPTEAERLKYWSDVAWFHDIGVHERENDQGMVEWRLEHMSRAKGKILEVGCGTGRNLVAFQEAVEQKKIESITLIDVVPHMLEVCREKAKRLGLTCPISYKVSDAHALPFPDNSFDTICMTMCLCSCERPELALEEANRVLKKNGRLLLIEHGRSYYPIVEPVMKFCHLRDANHAWEYGCYDDRYPMELAKQLRMPVHSWTMYYLGTWYILSLGKGHGLKKTREQKRLWREEVNKRVELEKQMEEERRALREKMGYDDKPVTVSGNVVASGNDVMTSDGFTLRNGRKEPMGPSYTLPSSDFHANTQHHTRPGNHHTHPGSHTHDHARPASENISRKLCGCGSHGASSCVQPLPEETREQLAAPSLAQDDYDDGYDEDLPTDAAADARTVADGAVVPLDPVDGSVPVDTNVPDSRSVQIMKGLLNRQGIKVRDLDTFRIQEDLTKDRRDFLDEYWNKHCSEKNAHMKRM